MAYDPSNNATAGDPWNAAFLVPINFVPRAGVYLTPACFNDGVYEDDATRLCLSNLIASEIRRFVIDVYWDSPARTFRLCPVQIPPNGNNLTAQVPSDDGIQEDSVPISTGDLVSGIELRARQTDLSNSTSAVTATASANATVASSTTTELPVTSTDASGTVLLQIGEYSCSPSLTLETVTSIFDNYYDRSATTLDARLHVLILNLHVARSWASPETTPADLPDSALPRANEFLSKWFNEMDEYIYSPSELEEQRENLNASWYRRSNVDYLPLDSYFRTEVLPNGYLRTPDGWPNENYVLLVSQKRAVVGFGSIDSQIERYNFGEDGMFFPPGELVASRGITLDDSGNITSGCLYTEGEYEIAQVNSSWAVASIITSDLDAVYYGSDNLTACGISPAVNATLENAAADDQPFAYQQLGNEALFSWAYDEPRNDTDRGSSIDSAQFRCALMVSNDAYKGHWRVQDCQSRYRVACREGNSPYRWSLSNNAVSYANGPNACTGNTRFDVPRTGLENTYLYHRIISSRPLGLLDGVRDGVWINFNSLDVETCWVTSGPSGTCPYGIDEDAERQRQILVPALGALIVLFLTILTILVKCNANRRNSKIRKRGEGGWDYEGVPS